MNLLYPFEVDDRHDADTQVDVARDIDLIGLEGTMQSLVEKHIRFFRQINPFGECPRCGAVTLGFFFVMDIVAAFATTGFTILAEEIFQIGEQVGFRAEMTEVIVAGGCPFFHLGLHCLAIIAVETVALDDFGVDFFAPENVLKRARDRRGAGARRASNGDDGMLERHVTFPLSLNDIRCATQSARNSVRVENSGELNGRSSPFAYSV